MSTYTKRATCISLSFTAVAFLASAAGAEGSSVERKMESWERTVWSEERIPAEHWIPRVETLEQMVRRGEYEAADFEAQDLIVQMVEYDAGREADAEYLARAVGYHALAQAGRGRLEEAVWTWYTAQNLGARKHVDLSLYGDAGRYLAGKLLENDVPQEEIVDVFDPGGELRELQPPGRVKTVYPRRPKALREDNGKPLFSQIVFVHGIIDRAGKFRRPVVVDTGGYPTLTYRAFEALRDFRFTPARLGGKPVPVIHVVPVTFEDDRPEEYNQKWKDLEADGEAVGRRGSLGPVTAANR